VLLNQSYSYIQIDNETLLSLIPELTNSLDSKDVDRINEIED
jgi:hypothetical protein